MDEKAQKEALKELNKSLEENIKKRNRKIFWIVSIYLILVIVYQTIVGTLPGENPDFLGFKLIPIKSVQTKEKYNISVNDINNVNYFVEKDFKFPIIPFLVDLIDYYGDDISNGETVTLSPNSNVKLNYKVYNCYSNYAGKLVNENCDSHTVKYEEISIKHKIKIIKDSFPKDEVLYDGKYIKDISSYLKDEGKYKVILYYKKNFTTTKVRFEVEVLNDKENQ